MDTEFKVPMGFVQRRLPWILGGAMLVVYLITVGSGTNPGSLVTLGRVAGWDWRPAFTSPLHYLVTWPVGLLPASLQLIALNVMVGVLASLSLCLLARSVALLPHDRTKDQRQLERNDFSLLSVPAAWLPPTLAVLVCGLQLTFWENATAATGEMLDLLVFAWLIRCLLEFRLDHQERWLWKFAFVYGLGVANNYALVGFFPLFLVALVWIQWTNFLNWRFVVRMILFGLAGLLLYLLLPLVASQNPNGNFPFWEMLRTYMGMQKSALGAAFGSRYYLIFLNVTSLLPILFIGIRWPASFGDTSPTGQALTNLTTHVIHLVFFVACLFVTLDWYFSPRWVIKGAFALLPLYYLGALSVGYFAGYMLLVFGSKPDPNAKAWQRPSPVRRVVNGVLVIVVWVVLLAMPITLLVRNQPQIRLGNRPALQRLSAAVAASLPAKPTAVIGDDSIRLYALAETLRRQTPGHQHILIESGALKFPAFHRYMERRYGARWPKLRPELVHGTLVDAPTVIGTLAALHSAGGLYYSHPSFGYFFEAFYIKPAKSVYEMQIYPVGTVSAPALTAQEIQAQHAYWQQLKTTDFPPLMEARPAPAPGSKFREAPDQVDLNAFAAIQYSRTLNHFGVEVQRAGDFKLAGSYFSLSRQLNDKNASALINEEYNRNVQAGDRNSIPPSEAVLKLIAPFGGNSDALLNYCGPPDEPSACFFLAQNFSISGNYRQAAQALERTIFFNPTNITARLLYVAQLLQMPIPTRAMELIQELRARPPVPLTFEDELDLMRAEAWAHVGLTNLPAAEKLLEDSQRRFPKEPLPYVTQVQIYEGVNLITNAIGVLQRQLAVQPEDYPALVNLSAFYIRMGAFTNALPYLERALKIRPRDPTALLNRALARLNLAQQAKAPAELAPLVEAALADYLDLESTQPQNVPVIYGVAECYRLKKMREESTRNFKKLMTLVPPGSPQYRQTQDILERLDNGGW